MKTLELNQMEKIVGEGCLSSIAGAAVATVILGGSTLAAPVLSYWTLAAVVWMAGQVAYDCAQATH